MTAINVAPEIHVLFGLKDAIPQRTRNGIVISHTYSDLVRRDWADMLQEVQDFNPTISLDWAAQPEFTRIDGALTFCRFHKDGRVTFSAAPNEKTGGKEDVAGWCLRRRYAPLDCKIGTTVLDTTAFDNHWKTLEGTFETTNPVRNPQSTCLQNSGSELTARAQTKGDIPARRGLQFKVGCHGIIQADGPAPRVRCVMQKKKYSVLLPHGAKPCVEIQNGSGEWSTIRTLKDLPAVNLATGSDYTVEMFILNDRLVVGINNQFFHIQEMNLPIRPGAQPTPKKCDIPAGPIQFNAYNCRVAMGLALIKWADPDDLPYTGSFSTSTERKTYVPPETELIPHATGVANGGSLITATATVEDTSIDYIVTLTASPEGIETPLVTKCVLYKAPVWAYPTAAAIDVQAAMIGEWSVTHAMPPITSSSEATITLDRTLLSTKVSGSWEDYIDTDNPCEIVIRWKRRDSVTNAVTYDPAPVDGVAQYYKLFKGYVYFVSKQTDGVFENTMTVNMRDPMVRLQGNNARIDYRYPPLDWKFLDAAAIESTPVENQSAPELTDLKIYGADCIQEIVRIALGDGEADAINGNGDTRRFLPADHPPLISATDNAGGLLALYGGLGQAVTQNSWYFPPPFGDDAESWIKKISNEIDRCVAFYGWPDGADEDEWPVLCYGRIPEFLQKLHATQSSFITIPDTNYVSGDVNKLLLMASTETRPERNINRVLTLGDVPTGGLEAVLPSLRMGEARLPADDPRRAELSWEKTLVLRNSLYMLPGAAEAVALKIIADITGLLMQFPQLTFRGLPVQWGSVCVVRADGTGSDATLGLDGLPFRVERVRHSGTTGKLADWKTAVHTRPLSNSELAAIPV